MPKRRPEIIQSTAVKLLPLLLAFSIDGAAVADEVRVGRYQTQALKPTAEQQDLMIQIIEIDLGPEITTIGQAIERVLEGSGYRLLSEKNASPYRVMLFGMPLPEPHRHLGPMRLREALELLSGEAYRLVIDPVYRLVSFELAATAPQQNGGAGP